MPPKSESCHENRSLKSAAQLQWLLTTKTVVIRHAVVYALVTGGTAMYSCNKGFCAIVFAKISLQKISSQIRPTTRFLPTVLKRLAEAASELSPDNTTHQMNAMEIEFVLLS